MKTGSSSLQKIILRKMWQWLPSCPMIPASINLDELGYTDMGDSFEEMKLRAKEKNFNFPYLYDGENEKVSLAYGPVATPHVLYF